MERAYLGESFVQPFELYDAKDRTRRVDEASFSVEWKGQTVQSGDLALDEEGHIGSFRFNAERLGVHTITVRWRIGDDVWKQPFLMNVVEA